MIIKELWKLAKQKTALWPIAPKVKHDDLPGQIHTALVGYLWEGNGFQQDMPGRKTSQGFLNSILVHTEKKMPCLFVSTTFDIMQRWSSYQSPYSWNTWHVLRLHDNYEAITINDFFFLPFKDLPIYNVAYLSTACLSLCRTEITSWTLYWRLCRIWTLVSCFYDWMKH